MSDDDYDVEFCNFCRTRPAKMEDIGGGQFECQDCGAILEADSSSKLGVKVIREPPKDW